ncbi:hypothetical protein [Yinghuangia soli]|uniref:Uncharacterized protein n=1 Tax=Yinghuangia soli TaxID=2908204 RepID=A0AA41U1K4_9ACTN|nr:hypothetical protein [Yinghuangia soli]MCF2527657.1 hypothetical protein [Yinghuangia soli]
MRYMKTKLLFLGAGALAIPLTATAPAIGSGLHFYQNQTPVISVNGNTVNATGQVAGAGTSIVADLTVNYTFPVSCFNPGKSAGPVPGQSGSGSVTTPPQVIQAVHGNASFNISATITPTAPNKACPNKSWVATVGPVTVTSATVEINSSNGGFLTYTKTF